MQMHKENGKQGKAVETSFVFKNNKAKSSFDWPISKLGETDTIMIRQIIFTAKMQIQIQFDYFS